MKVIIFAFLTIILSACSSRPARVNDTFTVDIRGHEEELGMVEVQLERAFPRSGLRKVDVTVTYFPDDDAVCLLYRSDFFTYQQFWSAEGREMFMRALAQYEIDYSQRNLENNRRRTRNVYGTAEGFLSWRQFAFTTRTQGNMDKEFGYAFVERFPYFAVTQNQVIYENPIDVDDVRVSQEITLFFTRAQARALTAFFDPVLLHEFTIGRPVRSRGTEIGVDLYYYEFDEEEIEEPEAVDEGIYDYEADEY